MGWAGVNVARPVRSCAAGPRRLSRSCSCSLSLSRLCRSLPLVLDLVLVLLRSLLSALVYACAVFCYSCRGRSMPSSATSCLLRRASCVLRQAKLARSSFRESLELCVSLSRHCRPSPAAASCSSRMRTSLILDHVALDRSLQTPAQSPIDSLTRACVSLTTRCCCCCCERHVRNPRRRRNDRPESVRMHTRAPHRRS